IVLHPSTRIKNGMLPSLVVIAAQRLGIPEHDLQHAIMGARWGQDRDIEDEQTLIEICAEQGLDGQKLLAVAKEPESEHLYFDYTNQAIRAGMFGAPFYVYGEHTFWGQDRLEMLDKTIERA